MLTNKQAEELNNIIKENNPEIYNLLSEKGKTIFFPKQGILSQSAKAKGKKINATIGIAVEDNNSPMNLNSIAKNISLDPKDVFPYAPSFGKPELREKWKSMLYEKNLGLKGKRTSLPVVTNALTHALSIAGYLFINKSDNITVFDPSWENYNLIFANGYGAKFNLVSLFKNGKLNTGGLENKLKEQETEKKILLLNFPNNPVGYTPTEDEVEEITEIIKGSAKAGNKIVVMCDDAYFGLVYKEGIYKESIFSKFADLHENVLAIKLDAATKEDYVWGLRVGFITYASKGITEKTCQALEAKTAGAIRGNISNASNLSQSLLLNALNSKIYKSEKREKYELLKKRFMKVEEVLKDPKYLEFFSPLPFNSGYFMCVQLSSLDAEKVRKILLEKYDTGLISIKNMLRIAFSSVAEKNIKQLFENIYNACKEVK